MAVVRRAPGIKHFVVVRAMTPLSSPGFLFRRWGVIQRLVLSKQALG